MYEQEINKYRDARIYGDGVKAFIFDPRTNKRQIFKNKLQLKKYLNRPSKYKITSKYETEQNKRDAANLNKELQKEIIRNTNIKDDIFINDIKWRILRNAPNNSIIKRLHPDKFKEILERNIRDAKNINIVSSIISDPFVPKDGKTEKRGIISNEYWKDKNSVEPPQYMTLSNKINSKEAQKLLWQNDIKELKNIIKDATKKEEKNTNLEELNKTLVDDGIKIQTYTRNLFSLFEKRNIENKGYNKKRAKDDIDKFFKDLKKIVKVKGNNLAVYKIMYESFLNNINKLPEINNFGVIWYSNKDLEKYAAVIESLIIAYKNDKYDDEIKNILGPEKVDNVMENLDYDKIAEDYLNELINKFVEEGEQKEEQPGPLGMENIEEWQN